LETQEKELDSSILVLTIWFEKMGESILEGNVGWKTTFGKLEEKIKTKKT